MLVIQYGWQEILLNHDHFFGGSKKKKTKSFALD